MNKGKKISPVGENWSEYRKKHYTAEEIAENDLMVKLVVKSARIIQALFYIAVFSVRL